MTYTPADEDKLPAEEKISRARTQLNHTHPFYAAHLLCMHSREFPEWYQGMRTMATDFFHLYWDRAFVEKLTVEELKGVLVHEALHRIFMHPFRGRGRDPKLANIAMDLSINPWIKDTQLKLPTPHLYDEKYKDKDGNWFTWERIYTMLMEQAAANGKGKQPDQQEWGQIMEPRGPGGEKLTEAEAKAQMTQAEQQNKAMLQAAKLAGQVPGNMAELIDQMAEPDIDYDEIIFRVFKGATPSGYSMRNPSKSVLHNFGLYASGRNRSGSGVVGIGFDTSGSITSTEASNVLGIINSVIQQTRPDKIVVIQFDHAVQDVQFYDAHSEIPEIQIHGRGGTSFKPQFEWIEQNDIHIDQFLVVTDGYGDFPDKPAPFPTTWLMTTDVKAPWGVTVPFKVKAV